jgi:hypothetical protein
MGTSFNNQWVLGRAPPRRGEPAIVSESARHHTDPAGEEGPVPADTHRAGEPHRPPANARSGHAGSTFGIAFTRRRVRKHPRWVDRDT